MTRSDGTPTNAVYGFTQMVLKIVEETKADHIAVIFDHARKTFRNDIFQDYKAHRPPPPDDLIPQFDMVREATRAMNVAAVEMEGYEADDLIATYSKQASQRNAEVVIVSTDKDLMQLVTDKIKMYDAVKNTFIDADKVVEKFGVGPEKVIDVQSLAGDSADNVPGVQGIGIKTAASLVREFGNLENVLTNAGKIKQKKRSEALLEQAELARISKQLVTLKQDVPVEVKIEEFKFNGVDYDKFHSFLEKQEFKSLISRINGNLNKTYKETESSSSKKSERNSIAKLRPDFQVDREAYRLIQNVSDLEKLIRGCYSNGYLAVDTETTSLNPFAADLVGISICTDHEPAAYIPISHKACVQQTDLLMEKKDTKEEWLLEKGQIKIDTVLDLLKPLLEDSSILKVGHNIKYDIEVLAKYKINVTPTDDTMILSYVLEGGKHRHGLDELSDLYLDHTTIKFKDVTGSGKSKISFDKVPINDALEYAAEDADITDRLFKLLKPRLYQDRMVSVYENLERPLIQILKNMEECGVKLDTRRLLTLSEDFSKRLGDLETQIFKLAGKSFNVGSPKQLGEILFEEMKLPGGKKGKSGSYGTGSEVLEDLILQGHEFPKIILDWRQLAKLKSTYTDSLLSQVNPVTGRVHTNYGQAIASTGRLSSTEPNLQNIPIRTDEGRKIRQAFIPSEGNLVLSADYSQIELRLLAHVADIKALKEAFEANIDIHSLTASQVFGTPVEDIDDDMRRKAKAINFGIIYGISAFGLARQLNIPRSEAAEYIDAYFSKYPGIKNYMETTVEHAKERGYVETLYGRKCFVPGILDKNSATRNFMERAAINAPIQGGAADIIKLAMIRMPGELEKADLSAKMLLQVHDELIFDVPKEELDVTSSLIKKTMETVCHLSVPLIVDIGHGKNWDEAH